MRSLPDALFGRTVRWTDRLAELTALRLVLWLSLVALTHAGIFTDPFNLASWMDDHQFYAWEESDRTTLLRFGQLPAWNPYWCGGTVGIPAPEDPFLSPDFVLRLVFGVAHGRRLTILLLVVLGLEGMYRLCRRLDASATGAAFAAVVFANCDKFVGFIHDGWVHFIGFELIPWVLLALIAGTSSWRWRLVGGFFFAWIVLAPGTYPTPFALIALAYVALALSLAVIVRPPKTLLDADGPPARWWRTPAASIWVSGLAMGIVAFGITFGKLVPTLMWVRQFARTFTVTEVHDVSKVFAEMWPHYGVVVTIALVGLATADLAAAIFSGGAVLAFALACGDYGPLAPFHLLKALPIVGQLRLPERYMVLFVLFTSVAAARGITRVEDAIPVVFRRIWEGVFRIARRPAPPLPTFAGWLTVGLAAFLVYGQVRAIATEVVQPMVIPAHAMYPEPAPRAYDQPFRQHRGNRRDAHVFPPMNMGSLYCAAGNPLPESPLLRGDLPADEYPVDPAKATVTRRSWSPLVIELDVDAKEPTTIYVNQNWAREWHSNVGTVKSVQKLLTVDVPAGKNLVRLEYEDRFLASCILVSIASLLGILFVFGRDGVRWLRRELANIGTMPLWPPRADDVTEISASAAPTSIPPAAVTPAAVVPIVAIVADDVDSSGPRGDGDERASARATQDDDV